MNKRKYISPVCDYVQFAEDVLAGGGMLKNSGYEENFMAPARVNKQYV